MAEDLFKTLIKEGGVVKRKVSVFSNKITKLQESLLNEENISEQTIIELEDRIGQISDISNEFDSIQSQIEVEILDDESKFMEQLAQGEQFLQNFYDSFASAKHLLNQLKPANNSNSDHNSDKNSSISSKNCNSPAVKLPDIKLPTFSGSSNTWLEFRDTFIALINDNPDIDDINKLHYLRASLEGSASQIIQSLEISAGTYKVAWDLLCKRYDNKKALIYNHLDALIGLEKIIKVSSFKLRNLSDTVFKHLRALNSLKLPTDQWDILILHLMAKSLDDGSVSKWEEYKSKKDLPSLEDMCEFLRSRSDLLERLELNKLEQGSKSGKTRGLLSADSENNSH
ncbi:uncharacterized protein LOC130443320 [Diorhabda sublineata]|uniref:uncharacterized protein LOC130443320 n=1 Tax=Diorhabda sublineata TaxID=1163346 RepID=UPI0024E1633A|nr:uncharacterized protein LOC130443320 [Diorhabda sublineata]